MKENTRLKRAHTLAAFVGSLVAKIHQLGPCKGT